MKIEVKSDKDKSEAELKISVDAEEIAPYLNDAAKKLSTDKPLKGFRPGRAPLQVVQEAWGKERVLNEAIERAVPKFFVEAVLAKKIEAIDRPKVVIESLSEGGVEFTATVSVLPQVKLGDITKIQAAREKIKIDDARVEEELKHLVKTRGKYIDVARPAQKGDTVTVDFQIFMDGQLMEGGESKNHPVHLGEGHFVADFEKNLLGIQPQDTREFKINFPEDFARETLRGKQAEARVVAHAVQKRVLPEINDEFARQLGDFKNLADLKMKLRENLQQEFETRETERWRGELADELAKAAKFGHIPEILIDKEIDRRIHDLEHMLTYQRKTMAEYLDAQNKDMKRLRAELRNTAEKAVKVGLALRQFAEEQMIAVDREQIEERMNEYLQRGAPSEAALKQMDKNELRDNIEQMLKNQKTLEKLEELAGAQKKKVNGKE